MLRSIQLGQRLLESFGVGCNLGVLDAVACRGQAGVGLFDAMLDGGKFASFEVGELLLGARTGRRCSTCPLCGA